MTCQGMTKAGKPCKFHAKENGYCKHHQSQASLPENVAYLSEKKDTAYSLAATRRKEARVQREKTGALPGQKLVGGKKDGYVRRWVTSEPTNVDLKLSKGYSFVDKDDAPTTDTGAAKSHITGTQKSGEAQLSYLMEIPEEFHDEDQQEKERQIARMQGDALDPKRDAIGTGLDSSKRYDPFSDPSSKHYRSA